MGSTAVPADLGVLVVHDDPATLYWLERVLTHAGHRVVSDTNLTEALVRLRDDATIGMLVADWHLGEHDAAALVQEVRERDPALPALIVTAETAALSRIRHNLPSDVLVLFTPVDETSLLDMVAHLWRRATAGAAARRAPSRTSAPPAPDPAGGVVLVVDDEQMVRHLAMRILTAEGYAVLEARNGEEALTVLQNLVAPVRLVLTDVRMPVMDGRALGERLARSHPDLPVVYMSGHGGAGAGQEPSLAPFLAKPFRPEALVAAIRGLLAAPSCPGA